MRFALLLVLFAAAVVHAQLTYQGYFFARSNTSKTYNVESNLPFEPEDDGSNGPLKPIFYNRFKAYPNATSNWSSFATGAFLAQQPEMAVIPARYLSYRAANYRIYLTTPNEYLFDYSANTYEHARYAPLPSSFVADRSCTSGFTPSQGVPLCDNIIYTWTGDSATLGFYADEGGSYFVEPLTYTPFAGITNLGNETQDTDKYFPKDFYTNGLINLGLNHTVAFWFELGNGTAKSLGVGESMTLLTLRGQTDHYYDYSGVPEINEFATFGPTSYAFRNITYQLLQAVYVDSAHYNVTFEVKNQATTTTAATGTIATLAFNKVYMIAYTSNGVTGSGSTSYQALVYDNGVAMGSPSSFTFGEEFSLSRRDYLHRKQYHYTNAASLGAFWGPAYLDFIIGGGPGNTTHASTYDIFTKTAREFGIEPDNVVENFFNGQIDSFVRLPPMNAKDLAAIQLVMFDKTMTLGELDGVATRGILTDEADITSGLTYTASPTPAPTTSQTSAPTSQPTPQPTPECDDDEDCPDSCRRDLIFPSCVNGQCVNLNYSALGCNRCSRDKEDDDDEEDDEDNNNHVPLRCRRKKIRICLKHPNKNRVNSMCVSQQAVRNAFCNNAQLRPRVVGFGRCKPVQFNFTCDDFPFMPPATSILAPTDATASGSMSTSFLVVGLVGVVAAAVASVFGVFAVVKAKRAERLIKQLTKEHNAVQVVEDDRDVGEYGTEMSQVGSGLDLRQIQQVYQSDDS